MKQIKNLINKLQSLLIHKFGGVTYQESLLAQEPKTTFTISSYPEIITLHSNYVIDGEYYELVPEESLDFAKNQCVYKIAQKILEDGLYTTAIEEKIGKELNIDMEIKIVKFKK